MNATKKLSVLLGIPLLGVILSLLTAHFATPLTTNNDGIGSGKELIIVGAVIYGVLGLIASLILGPLVAHFTKRPQNPQGMQLGYVVPGLIAFSIILYGFISVVILGKAMPY